MKTIKSVLSLVFWRCVYVLRIAAMALCVICLVYKAYEIIRYYIENEAIESWTVFVLPVLIIFAIILLRSAKDPVEVYLEGAKIKREIARAERTLRIWEKADVDNLKKKRSRQLYEQEMGSTGSGEFFEGQIRKFPVMKVSSNPEAELQELVGMAAAKQKVEEVKALMMYEKKHMSSGATRPDHMRFVGNPGTGKTSIGRIMAGILYREHRIPQNKYIEVNANELVGAYIGQTPLIVRQLFEQAAGGVLFIDEAYALATQGTGGYGAEAVNQLLSLLEDPKSKTVVFFAGYKYEMDQFLKMNPGLPSRIPTEIEFPDYSPLELCQILVSMLKGPGREHGITRDAIEAIYDAIKQKQRICVQTNIPFGNARYIRNVADDLHRRHALNYANGVVKGKDICLADVDRNTLLKLN